METILHQRRQQHITTAGEAGLKSSKLLSEVELPKSLEHDTSLDAALQNLCSVLRELQLHLVTYGDDNDQSNDEDNSSLPLSSTQADTTRIATVVPPASKSQASNEIDDGSAITIDELVEMCSKIQASTYLQPIQIVRAIVDAAALPNEAHQQAALFDIFGSDSDEAMQVLIDVGSKLSYIQQHINADDIDQYVARTKLESHYRDSAMSSYNEEPTYVDIEEERRQLLLQEAMDAAQVAAIAQAQIDNGGNFTKANSGTHTVARNSDKQALKFAEKAKKRAASALQRAKDAGVVILNEDDLLNINGQDHALGTGGLINRTEDEIWELQKSLLPEGTREYYDHRGLPTDAIREVIGDMERVIIPAKLRDETSLPQRLLISNIMDPILGQAFEGTKSLNPMQSTTFPIAFHARDNMMICAPTGAGKTNVAMLTVVAHFRDVGLIGTSASNVLETGKKVVYIAPMKALAQEVVEKFSSKLKSLRLIVRELTGDMQLTRSEAEAANVIVTTPEKWDVVTRKSGTDENALGNQCGLLIIDEVHLLADERGAVIESVVSRLHRLVESRQRQVRIVALSATLPNYDDVANFLQVPERGIFYFGPEHRPVPLQQTFMGLAVSNKNRAMKEKRMNEVCFDTVLDSLQRGYQVMVFVHSRKGTGDTAKALVEIASLEGVLEKHFVTAGKDGPNGEAHKRYVERVKKSRNRELASHFEYGCGIHHAGMLRGDRKLSEQMFNDGAIKVLCCTATLAWGINLPAHTVVIKGTEVYNPEKGGIVDLSILDVQQIFGRAGRPQFDSSGEANLITTSDAFPRYMDKLVRPVPIESNFIKQLADHLNAEVVGGTVTNISEASTWLTYTYLYVRMMRNPQAYGISLDQKSNDPNLRQRCVGLVTDAAKLLDANKMVRLDQNSGNLGVVYNGRVAAHFYIQAESVATFLEMFSQTPFPSDSDLCRIICSATEFRNMKLRQEEMDELQQVAANSCPFSIKGAGTDDKGHNLITDSIDKSFVLLQAYISRALIKSFTLISDMNYIASNAGRVARALFEMCVQEKKATEAAKLLRIANSVDKQIWWFKTPLRNFENEFKEAVYSAVELYFGSSRHQNSYDDILSFLEMQPEEVGQICKANKAFGTKIQRFVGILPNMWISCHVKPITSAVLRFQVQLDADFEWDGRWHGGAQNLWMSVEDRDSNKIHHQEHIILSKRTYKDSVVLEFMVPMFSPVPEQYHIRLCADGWVGVENVFPVPLKDIEIPKESAPYTDLLDLTPLPTTALNNPTYEMLYTKFQTFNPIQTQLFHVLYHTDSAVLLGAPTGSGKTLVAELAILRLKRIQPKGICVYIAPIKALAGERMKDWRKRFGSPPLSWNVLELSGDTHHDQTTLERADILVCTPEKWDLVSRGWRGVKDYSGEQDSKTREYISRVGLLIMDEVHLLGEERGAVLEAIVSRTRFISRHIASKTSRDNLVQSPTRIIGLSTALANPFDLADWIGIDASGHSPTSLRGLYNFRPSVRPVPTEIHTQGYPGKHYCPRMATMNKPCYAAIKELSPVKPTLIFVASRRQTRLTAFDIISYAASDERPKMFLGCDETYVEAIADKVHDEALRHTIAFGIGLHHAGLSSHDRDIVEKMFLDGYIKVLVATATLAWGVNLPAHLVIVKGTEYFDGKSSRYVDYPLTDVLQMIGRAGRPGFDTHADAVVMVREEMKDYYKRFLYSAFPVESCLEQRIHENLNAEIASGTIQTISDCVGYLSWTYFARRMKKNPIYYGAESSSPEHIETRLFDFVKDSVATLRSEGCLEVQDLDAFSEIKSTALGIAASQYYLSHRTPKQMQVGIRECRKIILKMMKNNVKATSESMLASIEGIAQPFTQPQNIDEPSIAWLLFALCSTHEFDELPVRHNEEHLNEDLSKEVMWGPDVADVLSGNKNSQRQLYRNPEIYLDPHTKAFILVQAYLEYAKLPISDYVNDTKSVMENLPRILAAMLYIAATAECEAEGSFELLTQFNRTRQLLMARCKVDDDPLQQLPGFSASIVQRLQSRKRNGGTVSLHQMRSLQRKDVEKEIQYAFLNSVSKRNHDALNMLYGLPLITVTAPIMNFEVDKRTNRSIGKLILSINIDRANPSSNKKILTNGSKDSNNSVTVMVLLGSYHQRLLLASSTIRITRYGSWTIQKELEFDWNKAKSDGDSNKVIIRLLLDEVRGLDLEMIVSLNESKS